MIVLGGNPFSIYETSDNIHLSEHSTNFKYKVVWITYVSYHNQAVCIW